MSIWIGLAISAAAIGLVGFAGKMNRASKLLETKTSAKIKTIDFSKIVIDLTVLVKNPSDAHLKIQFPFIKIKYKGQDIGSTDIVNQQVDIKPYSKTTLGKITLSVSLFKLPAIVAEAIAILQSGKGNIKLLVTTYTTIYTDVAKIPYDFTEEITL